MKKKITLTIFVVIIAGISAFFLLNEEEKEQISINPQFGTFKSQVSVSGELRAKNSIEIKGPGDVRRLNIWNMKISKLVDEGTVVNEGDFVAELEKSEVMSKLNEVQLNIDKIRTEFKQKQLDSSLTLSNARNELVNLKYAMEERKLEMKQAKYEPPSVQRKAQISHEQAVRSYKQAKRNYKTKVEQAKAELKIIQTDLSKEQVKLDLIKRILSDFTIKAPSSGMVVYDKSWNGRKKTVGSQINAWDPVVATLPDLSSMESVTYVNEIDIQKIEKDQHVDLKLDANPEKDIQGKVKSVANIGQELKTSDAKVFEVIIEVLTKDTTLLPAMTTSNEILIAKKDSVLSIPLECLFGKTEGKKKISYVYKKNGSGVVKQQVKTGIMNENNVIIKEGLKKEDEIYMIEPVTEKEIEFIKLEEKAPEDNA